MALRPSQGGIPDERIIKTHHIYVLFGLRPPIFTPHRPPPTLPPYLRLPLLQQHVPSAWLGITIYRIVKIFAVLIEITQNVDAAYLWP